MNYNFKVMARASFMDCTHYNMEPITKMASGALIDRCDKCQCEMVCFTTGSMRFSQGDEIADMESLCKDYLGLKPFEPLLYPDCGNVEDYSDEYEVCCNDCSEQIMEDYYASN